MHARAAIPASPQKDETSVRVSPPFRAAAFAAMAIVFANLPCALSAQARSAQATPPPMPPWPQREASDSGILGNYLAARHASIGRDSASASAYYRSALKIDPKNAGLLELAFYAVLADGDIEEAVRLGDRLLQIDKTAKNPNARLVLGARALKQQKYQQARTQLKEAARGPVADLIGTLLAGWTLYGANDSKGAIELIDRLPGPDWYAIFKDLHAGLILDLAGNRKEAGKRFERAYKLDSSALRVVQAYGGWLSRNGQRDEALKVFQTFDAALPRHPLVRASIDSIQKGQPLPRLVEGVNAGAAEALYGLGAALARREEELSLSNRGLAYLQLALYFEPDHALALLSLADLYEAMKKPELAIDRKSVV